MPQEHEEQELPKSKRNWEEDSRQRAHKLTELSLISRSSNDGSEGKSLRDFSLQRKLWNHVFREWRQCKTATDPAVFRPLVEQLRKLREGVVASQWSHGNHKFVSQVFELSSVCSLRAEDYNEFFKSLRGLVKEYYSLKEVSSKSYFIALYHLYLACYLHDAPSALQEMADQWQQDDPNIVFAREVIRCILIRRNPFRFFQLYRECPEPAFQKLMDFAVDRVRSRAVNVMAKAYYDIPVAWAGHWLGLEKEEDGVLRQFEKILPGCVASVTEDHRIQFMRKK